MKKIVAISIAVLSLIVLASSSFAFTGLFYKAFSKNFVPDEIFEQNITVRKFYNLTVKFQKINSTSDLTIRNSNTEIILKDSNYSVIQRFVGFNGTSLHSVIDRKILDEIRFISAHNISNSANNYEDVQDQPVLISYLGTRATIVIKVNLKNSSAVVSTSGNSTFSGYVIDELTHTPLENMQVAIFSGNSEIARNSTNTNGRFVLNFASGNYDVFVSDYSVAL